MAKTKAETESKQHALGMLVYALHHTRAGADVGAIEVTPDGDAARVYTPNSVINVNIACDSALQAIIDVCGALMYGADIGVEDTMTAVELGTALRELWYKSYGVFSGERAQDVFIWVLESQKYLSAILDDASYAKTLTLEEKSVLAKAYNDLSNSYCATLGALQERIRRESKA